MTLEGFCMVRALDIRVFVNEVQGYHQARVRHRLYLRTLRRVQLQDVRVVAVGLYLSFSPKA